MANTNTYCNDPEEAACLDALIAEINDDLTIACQIPFTVPKKELAHIIQRAKDYFYKIYEDSVEQMYIALPGGAVQRAAFKQGVPFADGVPHETITNAANINNPRGIIQMPSRVWAVNAVFEMGGWSGEDGGFGDYSFNAGDVDFSIDKFIYSDVYGAGIGSENLMYYVVNSLFLDNTRQVLLPQISYTYNRLTKKFRFQGNYRREHVFLKYFLQFLIVRYSKMKLLSDML